MKTAETVRVRLCLTVCASACLCLSVYLPVCLTLSASPLTHLSPPCPAALPSPRLAVSPPAPHRWPRSRSIRPFLHTPSLHALLFLQCLSLPVCVSDMKAAAAASLHLCPPVRVSFFLCTCLCISLPVCVSVRMFLSLLCLSFDVHGN